MDLYSAEHWAGLAVSVMTAIGLAYAFWRWARPILKRGWDNVMAVLVALLTLPEMQVAQSTILRQVTLNGGSSLPDSLNRLEKGMDTVRQDVAHLTTRIAVTEATSRAKADGDMTVASFECFPDGSNAFVGDTYARWLDCDTEDLIGWGYMSYVHPDDRATVRDEIEHCITEVRKFGLRYRLGSATVPYFTVETSARPIIVDGHAVRWIGASRKVDA